MTMYGWMIARLLIKLNTIIKAKITFIGIFYFLNVLNNKKTRAMGL